MSLVLWAVLVTHVDVMTGEILRSRQELADETGIGQDNVSRLLTELVGLGVVERERVRIAGLPGRGAVRYWLRTDFSAENVLEKAGLLSAPGMPPMRLRRRAKRKEEGI